MNIEQGSLENIILNALWHLEETGQEIIDVSNIQYRINLNNKKWAYTTVKTVLDRLVEKKVIFRYKEGKKYYYNSKISRIEAGNSAVKKLAKQYFNNNIDELIIAVEKVQNEMLILVG